MRKPDFDNILKVLRRETPDRPTLFEFFLNMPLHARLTGVTADPSDREAFWSNATRAMHRAGYDYATIHGSLFHFPSGEHQAARSISQNEGVVIRDEESFEAYDWPDPENFDRSILDTISADLADGMQFILVGPGGVLENAIILAGYEGVCLMAMEDPELTGRLFDEVGARILRQYELCVGHGMIGAAIGNDDWGFKAQTVLPPDLMRRYVFPWHKRIVEAIHAAGKPAILHSCGNLAAVMDDVIDDIGYDAKHSYEDTIQPVEDAYEQYGDRIAILGGIDVDFVCRATPDAVRERSRAMLERSTERGGYALGSGNSIPDYVPEENYLAMISAAVDVTGM